MTEGEKRKSTKETGEREKLGKEGKIRPRKREKT